MKVYAIIAVFVISILGMGGKYLYSLGYETAERDLKGAQAEAISNVIQKKDAEREALEKKLSTDYANDLRDRDERLREFEDFVRAGGSEKCSADERNAITRIAVGLEEVAVKAIRFLEAERKN